MRCRPLEPDLAAAVRAVPSLGAVIRRLLYLHLRLFCVRRYEKGIAAACCAYRDNKKEWGSSPCIIIFLKKMLLGEINYFLFPFY